MTNEQKADPFIKWLEEPKSFEGYVISEKARVRIIEKYKELNRL